jgi:hypothetical protein
MRRSMKILGLSLVAALSLMALTAAGAQAGEFKVGGKTFTAAGVTSETVGGTLPLGILLVSNGLEIHCNKGDVKHALAKQGGTASAELLFLECKVLNNKFCTIYPTEEDLEEETNSGRIIAAGSGELILHSGAHYLKAASASFSTVYMGGPACTLPAKNVVSGSTALSLPSALSELVEQPVSTINAATEALLKVQLFYGKETATLDGAAGAAKLTGENAGKTWGGE